VYILSLFKKRSARHQTAELVTKVNNTVEQNAADSCTKGTTSIGFLNRLTANLMRWLTELLIFMFVFIGIIAWQQKDMLSTDGSVIIPNTKLVSIDGQTQTLLAIDKPTLLYFFAPWCKVCELSISNVDAFDPAKVKVLKVALDYASTEAVEIFAQATQTDRNIVFGNKAVQKQFAVTAFPSVYIVEPSGEIVGRSVGYTTTLGYKLRVAFGTQ